MALLRIKNFGGLVPKASGREIPDDGARVNHNLLSSTPEFRPLGADVQVVAASGVNNPQTIYRLQRNADGTLNTDFTTAANWKVFAGPISFARYPINSDATDRTVYTFDDGSAAPRWLDALGTDRLLGVPKPAKPTAAVNVVDEFTPEERTTDIDSGLALSVSAIKDHLSVSWVGADLPGLVTTGVLDRTLAMGFAQDNPAQQVRAYRLAGVGGAISNSYSAVDASMFSWVLDPLLGAIPFTTGATPVWAGGAGTPHLGVAYSAYGMTFVADAASITTQLAALPMPGTTDGTKLWTGAQVTQIVNVVSTVLDPTGPDVAPTIALLRTRVNDLRVLLDGGGRASLAAMLQAFYSKVDVAAEITAAIDNFANNVFQQADLVARSSLAADFIVSGDGGQ